MLKNLKKLSKFCLTQFQINLSILKSVSNIDKMGIWLRRTDLNRRPSGYEPDELPLLYSAIRVVWDF